MKYVLTQIKRLEFREPLQQAHHMMGFIQWSNSNTEDLNVEHTDGLNYVNTEFSRHDDISSILKLKNTDKFK
jgi:hypothetical protein